MGYRAKNETELDRLDDDALFEQIKAAREAGDQDQFRSAIGVFAWRRSENVFARIRLKVGDIEDAWDLVQLVMLHALKVKFKGEHIGEFVSLLHKITSRRIADYYSGKTLESDPLVEEGGDDDELWGEVPSVEDFSGHSTTLAVYEQALEELSDRHRMVVEQTIKGLSAKEVADEVNAVFVDEEISMTDANVHQIMKRFRNVLDPHLRSEL